MAKSFLLVNILRVYFGKAAKAGKQLSDVRLGVELAPNAIGLNCSHPTDGISTSLVNVLVS